MSEPFRSGNYSLVLSGGGALGIAHLGVLHDLEKLGSVPGEIVGTSMGGIVGACVAIGMPERDIFERIRLFSGLHKWFRFSRGGASVVDESKIAALFSQIFGERRMRETDIALRLIATDLLSGEKRVFGPDDDVRLSDALLATMAIPGIFNPRRIGGALYADGFLCENLGVSETAFDDVLAVDVLGANAFERSGAEDALLAGSVLEMFERSMRLLIYNQTRTHLKHCGKRVRLVEPATKAFRTYHFHKAEAIRATGLGLLQQL